MNSLPITLQAQLDSSKATRSLDSLVNKRRDILLNAKIDVSSLNRAQKALGVISHSASEFEKSMEAANARVLAFGTSVAVIEGMRRSFLALIKTTAEVENALVKISSVSEDSLKKSGISIDQLGAKLFQIARETGQSFAIVGEAALEFSRQGLEVAETLKRTKDALILTRLSGLDATASVEALTAAYNTFKNQVSGTNEILQKLVAVDNASAASMADLAQGIQRVGSIAQNVGQDINEVVASIAVLQEATARGGSVIGNSFKTILERAQRLENLKLFESLGVDTSFEGKVRPTIQLLQDLAKITSDPAFTGNKTGILRQLAGNFQINQLSAFLGVLTEIGGETNRYEELLNTSRQASNEATKQNEKFSQTLVAGLNEANVAIQELLNSFGKAGIKDPFSGFVSSFTSAIDSVKNVIGDEGFTVDIVKGIAKGFGGALFSLPVITLAGLALSKIVYNFFKFAKDAGRDFLQLNQTTKAQEKLQLSIGQIISNNSGILQGVRNTEQGRLLLTQRIADAYERQMVAAAAINQLTKAASVGVFNQGFRISSEGIKKTGRAAGGYLPSLVRDETSDIKNGVGGASPGSKVVVIPNFPFGGGEKGLMVANSSEKFVKTGSGYSILNPDMQGGRAADGFLAPKATIQNKKGKFIGGTELSGIEQSVGSLVSLLVGLGTSASGINSALKNFVGNMDLQAKSYQLLVKLGNEHAQSLKNQALASKAAEDAQKRITEDQNAFIKGGGPNLSRLNKGGTGFTPSVAGVSGLGFRDRGKKEGPNRNPFAFVSDVYNTPEVFPNPETTRLERERNAKVIKNRLAIDNQRRREKQSEAKKLLDERKDLAERLNERELASGERKGFLRRLTGRKEDVTYNGRKLSASDARKRVSSDLSTTSLQEKFLRESLRQKDKELFEKYGIDTSSSGPNRISDSQRASNDALKARLQANRANTGGYSSGSAGSRSSSGLSAIDARTPLLPIEAEETRKTWKDSLGKFAVLSIAASGLASAFEDAQTLTGRFAGFLGQAIPNLLIFKEIGEIGGKSFKDIASSFGDLFGGGDKKPSNFRRGLAVGRAGRGSSLDFAEFGTANQRGVLAGSLSARAGRAIGGVASGAMALGRGALGFLPVVGQVALAANILYEGLKIFKPDLFEEIKVAFGGLSKAAQEAETSFDKFSQKIFDDTGKFTGISSKDAAGTLQSRLSSTFQTLEAQRRGLDVSGKDEQGVAKALFENNLKKALGGVFTGSSRQEGVYQTAVGSSVGVGAIKIGERTVADTFANLPESAQKIIIDQLSVVAAQTESDLRNVLKSQNVSKIGTKDLKDANLDELQAEIAKIYLENVAKIFSGSNFLKDGKLGDFLAKSEGRALLGQVGLNLFKSTKQEKPLSSFDPKRFTTVGFASEKVSSLFAERDVVFGIVSEQERRRKIETQIGEISTKRSLEIENELKLLEFQRSVQQDNLKIAEKTFDEIKKQAEKLREGGQLPIADVEKAQKTFSGINFSDAESVVKGLSEIRGSLTGSTTEDTKLVNSLREQLNLQKIINDLKEKGLKLDIRDAETIQKANFALESQKRILEIQRRSQDISGESKIIDIDRNITNLQNEGGRANTSAARKREIDFLVNEQEISKLEQEREAKRAEAARKIFDLNAAANKNGTAGSKDLEKAVINENAAFANSNKEISNKIANLQQLSSQLNDVKSDAIAFADAIDSFSRGIGESRGQNQFNLLQATDANSIVQGLIGEKVYDSAGGKGGAELVSFIADQNALLNEQFKIRTASSETERLSLERQFDLTQQILNIKNSSLSTSEKQSAIESAINSNLEQRRTFASGVQDAYAGMRDQVNNFGNEFGQTTTNAFRDGLSEAIKTAVTQTDNLKDALLDVALSFANKLRDAAIDNLVNNFMVGSKSSGGGGILSSVLSYFGSGVQKRATGGMVNGGSGNKDDVPTLLMGGEYIIPKDIVQSYGKGFFDRLRDGSIGKMASGGYFAPGVRGQGTISGKENLLDFATQTATSGSQDVISSLGANAGIVSLEPESLRLSNFARFGDSPIVQATQEAKEQAFGLYLDQYRQEEEYYKNLQETAEAKKKAEKEKKKQFLLSLAVAAVGAGLSYGTSKIGTKSKEIPINKDSRINKISESPNLNQKTAIESIKGLFKATAYGNADIDPTTARDQALANSGNPAYKGFSQTVGSSGRALIPGYSVASNSYKQGTLLKINGQVYRVDDTGGMSRNIIDFYSGSNKGLYKKYSTMGSINPYVLGRNSGGYASGAGDTIPAMLSNKEFVLNSAAAEKIGDKGLYALNNGAAPSGSSGEMEAKIVAKLDELINKTIGASNVNVTVNTGGGESGSEEKQDGGDQNQRQLAQRIKQTVVNVIREEQRPGGLLTSTRR